MFFGSLQKRNIIIIITVNNGFPELVDQDTLVKALQEGKIRGAGLDVMTPEPLPLDQPLIKMDNDGTYNKIIFLHTFISFIFV